jgi:hypothetical protein
MSFLMGLVLLDSRKLGEVFLMRCFPSSRAGFFLPEITAMGRLPSNQGLAHLTQALMQLLGGSFIAERHSNRWFRTLNSGYIIVVTLW